MIEKGQCFTVQETSKTKAKICAHCVMRVGSNHWVKHWMKKHKIYKKYKKKEYNGISDIPDPFFVSQPWMSETSTEEDSNTLKQLGKDELRSAMVLAEFMKKDRLYLPYAYRRYAKQVYRILGEDIYTISPMKECRGYGWYDYLTYRYDQAEKEYFGGNKGKYLRAYHFVDKKTAKLSKKK